MKQLFLDAKLMRKTETLLFLYRKIVKMGLLFLIYNFFTLKIM